MTVKRLTFFEITKDDNTYWVLFVKLPRKSCPGFTHKVVVLRAPELGEPVAKDWLAEGLNVPTRLQITPHIFGYRPARTVYPPAAKRVVGHPR